MRVFNINISPSFTTVLNTQWQWSFWSPSSCLQSSWGKAIPMTWTNIISFLDWTWMKDVIQTTRGIVFIDNWYIAQVLSCLCSISSWRWGAPSRRKWTDPFGCSSSPLHFVFSLDYGGGVTLSLPDGRTSPASSPSFGFWCKPYCSLILRMIFMILSCSKTLSLRVAESGKSFIWYSLLGFWRVLSRVLATSTQTIRTVDWELSSPQSAFSLGSPPPSSRCSTKSARVF